TTFPSSGMERSTRRATPLAASSPAITSTWSSLRTCMLHHLRRQADDLDEPALPQLAGDGPEDACAARVLLDVDQHPAVTVEADIAAVLPPRRFLGADDHALDDLARLDVATGDRLLDAGDDYVAQPGVAALRAPQHLDAHAFLGAGVVRHV